MKKTKNKILASVLVLLVLLQFIRPDKVYEEVNIKTDFLEVTNAPKHIAAIVKSNCYDCHSNQTVHPWYANVAPVSYFINHHVEEGKEHLNFSNWTSYSDKKADHKLEEFFEEVEEGEMPLKTYTFLHGKLSEKDKKELLNWVKHLRASE